MEQKPNLDERKDGSENFEKDNLRECKCEGIGTMERLRIKK